MKAEEAGITITDFVKVWCAQCGIRIDANEERTGVDGKAYHPHCYSKVLPDSQAERLTFLGPLSIP
jgi:hypothetical protein